MDFFFFFRGECRASADLPLLFSSLPLLLHAVLGMGGAQGDITMGVGLALSHPCRNVGGEGGVGIKAFLRVTGRRRECVTWTQCKELKRGRKFYFLASEIQEERRRERHRYHRKRHKMKRTLKWINGSFHSPQISNFRKKSFFLFEKKRARHSTVFRMGEIGSVGNGSAVRNKKTCDFGSHTHSSNTMRHLISCFFPPF